MVSFTKNPHLIISLFGFIVINLAIVSIAYIYSSKSESLLYHQAFQQLESVNELKYRSLAMYFSYRRADIRALAGSETVVNLAKELDKLDRRFNDLQSPRHYKEVVKLQKHYREHLSDFIHAYMYSDAFLIDASEGHIMYATHTPEVIGTNVTDYVAQSHPIAKVWKDVMQTQTVHISDMFLCSIHTYEPEMLIAAPVMDDNRLMAVLILQLPGNATSEIMHMREGMSETSESYLVGEDFLIRSNSFLEPIRFSVKNSFHHPETSAVKTDAVLRGLAGKKGNDIITDYRLTRVLSSYRPFALEGFVWAVISEVDEHEVIEQTARLKKKIYIWALSISLLLTIGGYFIIRRIIDTSVVQPLIQSHQRSKSFEDVIHNSLNEIYIFDKEDLHFTFVNRGAVLNTGYSEEEFKKMTPLAVKPEFSKDTFLQLLEPLTSGFQEQIAFETIHERKNGSRYDVDVRLQLMEIEGKKRFVAIINDITERNRTIAEKEHLYEISTHDHLTQLYNRHMFKELYEAEVNRSRRYTNRLTLLLFDIDHFKEVNDTYGHHRGDRVLQELSDYIRRQLRGSDIFARWGGEEFVILMPYITYEEAVQKAEMLRMGVEERSFEEVGTVTCSLGVVSVDIEETMEANIAKADEALYRAKATGRNVVVRYESDDG
ncbi:MAG: diguanylate cyclase [Sulfurimonadaceae bacterium]|nr:diguanylate cyclase [Sulfurimonadaceae bacterium]